MTASQNVWNLANVDQVATVRVDGKHVDTTIGKAGKQKTTSKALQDEEAAVAFARKQVNSFVDKGFFAQDITFERLPWADVSSKINVAGNSEDATDIVLVFRGDLTVPHNLLMDYREGILQGDEPVAGLYVDGNLVVEGALANFEDDYGPFLHVTGNLTAETIATGGSQIRIDGDVMAAVVVGVYNHGCLDIGGVLTTRLVASEHTVRARISNGLHYWGWDGTIHQHTNGKRDDADPYEVKGVFAKNVISGDSADLGKARKFCVEGRPFMLDEPISVRGAFRRLVAKKLEAPEKVKSISLTMKDLTELPDEILLFPMLEKLDLTHNQLRRLPDGIGKLTHLKELHLRGNGLQTLPDSIGQCTQLRVLNLEANCLVGLPDSLANCKELRVVNLVNNPYSYVRSSFRGWKNVRFMEELPEVLTQLPNLETLKFDDTLIRRLPKSSFISPHLRPITYEDTLLCDVDTRLHPQIPAPDLMKTRRWATDHVAFWFDSDHVRPSYFWNAKTGAYDFAEMRALLGVVLRTLVPAAAPYSDAVAQFKKETAEIVRRLRWDENHGDTHVKLLFQSLLEELDALGPELSAPSLIDGVREVFRSHVD